MTRRQKQHQCKIRDNHPPVAVINCKSDNNCDLRQIPANRVCIEVFWVYSERPGSSFEALKSTKKDLQQKKKRDTDY